MDIYFWGKSIYALGWKVSCFWGVVDIWFGGKSDVFFTQKWRALLPLYLPLLWAKWHIFTSRKAYFWGKNMGFMGEKAWKKVFSGMAFSGIFGEIGSKNGTLRGVLCRFWGWKRGIFGVLRGYERAKRGIFGLFRSVSLTRFSTIFSDRQTYFYENTHWLFEGKNTDYRDFGDLIFWTLGKGKRTKGFALIFLFIIIGIVYALHEHLTICYSVCQSKFAIGG